MDEPSVRKHFAHLFRHDPQRSGQAHVAMNQVYEGLQVLASLGQPMILVPGTGYIPQEFPRMYYKQDGTNRVVFSQAEADRLGPEWSLEQTPPPY